jgi:hypothetical protein
MGKEGYLRQVMVEEIPLGLAADAGHQSKSRDGDWSYSPRTERRLLQITDCQFGNSLILLALIGQRLYTTDSLTASVQHDGRDYSHENARQELITTSPLSTTAAGRASFAGDHHVIQMFPKSWDM